ncbi:MAG: 30S ribosomal protein S20 [Deltaproteobacteria bacterium]|nr:30S ribosomal protein S20 [Deltaproteobacteria bacterium]MBI3294096.1 30S ribosomal protein S20 [Deltaproteobacteria bacterium]
MERHKSALKAARQASKKRVRNTASRSRYKTFIRSLREGLAAAGADKEGAKKLLIPMMNNLQSVLMKAASKNLIKKKTASRYVSRLSSRVHKALS